MEKRKTFARRQNCDVMRGAEWPSAFACASRRRDSPWDPGLPPILASAKQKTTASKRNLFFRERMPNSRAAARRRDRGRPFAASKKKSKHSKRSSQALQRRSHVTAVWNNPEFIRNVRAQLRPGKVLATPASRPRYPLEPVGCSLCEKANPRQRISRPDAGGGQHFPGRS